MKILVVEGAPLIRRTIISALEHAHYDVRDVDRGRQAVHVLEDFRPQAVVIGSEVVGMSGAELARRVREHPTFARTPIILVSGRRSYEDVLKAVHCGVDEYIVTPFTGDVLIEKLEHALQRKGIAPATKPPLHPITGNLFLNT